MKTNKNNPTEGTNTAPIHSVNCGRVRASVWENIVSGTIQYKVILSSSIHRNGEWIRGKTFYNDELAAVIEVSARVQRWIEWRKRDAQSQLQLART